MHTLTHAKLDLLYVQLVYVLFLNKNVLKINKALLSTLLSQDQRYSVKVQTLAFLDGYVVRHGCL